MIRFIYFIEKVKVKIICFHKLRTFIFVKVIFGAYSSMNLTLTLTSKRKKCTAKLTGLIVFVLMQKKKVKIISCFGAIEQ